MINALKHPSFFRPASRPASPVTQPSSTPSSRPNSSNDTDRPPRSLNRISLNNFRRPPAGPLNAPLAPLVQDGSYLEVLSLKLSEAVSKALAQPTGPATLQEQVAGKRPIPQGRGRMLGALIASEFRATQDSPHLHRAILRSLQRPLSVLLTNLSGILLPLLSSPAFHSALAPTVQNPNPNPTQVHALATVGFVEELLETFDVLDLGADADLRGDSLKSIRDGLVSLVNRVVTPLVASIHKELVLILEALETPNAKLVHGAKASNPVHPSIIALQANMPVYVKAMARYTTSPASQATLATFLISVVWRGLVAFAHRPYTSPSPPASPGLSPLSPKKNRGTLTPPLTPPASRFTMKLPPTQPSSPLAQMAVASTAADAKTVFDLLNLFHRPSGDKEPTRLAREAVDDAFQGLNALPPLLEAAHSLALSAADSQHRVNELAYKLELLATEVPLLIALPVVLQASVPNQSTPVSVSGLIGLSETEYRSQCLSGFGRAEECATTVAFRMLATLRSHPGVHSVVSKWLGMEIAEALEKPVPA